MTRLSPRCGVLVLFGCIAACSSFGVDRRPLPMIPAPETAGDSPPPIRLPEAAVGALRAAALSVSVVVATLALPPSEEAHAAVPTLDEAIVELSEASYPILRSLDAANFQAFSTRIGDLLLEINPDRVGRAIDLGIDVLDSAPAEKVAEFGASLTAVYGDLSTDTCRLVPLPPSAVAGRFAALAADKVDAGKLEAFKEKWKPPVAALKITADDRICLPPTRAALDKLALAQADLGRSFGRAEARAFVSHTGPMLQTGIPQKKALSLVEDAKTLAPTATPQAKKDFAAAGKKAETASKLEIARNKVAEQKAKQAASRAALASGS
ncbi:unnamed protein product [Pseudo-nitzschia multistriata]|uniref:Uncharacterized protein n=1 Tax=Pseudo-nitzschia multistriata TaxID=183589 RepID=A0A448Z0A0_9STRA|nr:unnamed protein product [Pseudo-nitzschia multistriata]